MHFLKSVVRIVQLEGKGVGFDVCLGAAGDTKMKVEHYTALFSSMEKETLASRLAKVLAAAAREPALYLKGVLLPESVTGWFPVRLARQVKSAARMLAAHPLSYLATAFGHGPVGARKGRRFAVILVLSIAAHTTFVAYVLYASLLAPFSSFRLVDRDYNEFKDVVMLKPLPNPGRGMQAPSGAEALTLEEIKERDRLRREQQERREREKAEREKLERERLEKEKAEKEKAEQEARQQAAAEEKKVSAAADNKPASLQFGEINERPIKEIVSRTYEKYKAGQIDLNVMNFTVMAAFEIEADGTLSNVRIIESSGSQIIDQEARAILHAVSESHALGPIAHLSSNTIRFDLNEKFARLTITGFAPTASEARNQAGALNLLLSVARLAQQSKSPGTAELLSLVKVKSDNNRINAEMMVSRVRASEMMRERFGN